MINWNDNRVWAWLILGILFITVTIMIILSNCEKIEDDKPPKPMTDEEKIELQQKDQDQREVVIYPQNDKGGE